MLAGRAPDVPVAAVRKGRPRSTAVPEDRPRAGRVAGDLDLHAGLYAPSKLGTVGPQPGHE
jgi:hypothetical protein